VVDIIVFVVLETASTQPKKRDVTGNIRSRSQKQEMAKKGKNKRLLYKLQGLDRSSDRDVLENRGGKFELSVVRSRFFSERERELRSARVSIRRILCMSSLYLFSSHRMFVPRTRIFRSRANLVVGAARAYKLIVSHSHSCGPVIMLGGTPGGPCCAALAWPIPPP
jgi:hypothetical protein